MNMQIFVKDLGGKTGIYNILEETTLDMLKEQIAVNSAIQTDDYDLIYAGYALADEIKLQQQMQDEATAYMVLGLDGGKKKKKKKAFTTKKKTKHKHTSVKLAILSHYEVKGNTVTPARKPCVQCGPAFLMAQHYDRHYCGFCHLTLRVAPELAKQRLAELQRKQAAKKKDAVVVEAGKGTAKAAPKKKKAK